MREARNHVLVLEHPLAQWAAGRDLVAKHDTFVPKHSEQPSMPSAHCCIAGAL
jgi:hypothetical protein